MNVPATTRRPWTGETPTMPTRVGGQRVVAAVKLSTGSGPHEWAAVLEIAETATFAYARMVRNPEGFIEVRDRRTYTVYGLALRRLLAEVES